MCVNMIPYCGVEERKVVIFSLLAHTHTHINTNSAHGIQKENYITILYAMKHTQQQMVMIVTVNVMMSLLEQQHQWSTLYICTHTHIRFTRIRASFVWWWWMVGGAICVCMCTLSLSFSLYTIGHRNSLLSIFLFIFATFQLTARKGTHTRRVFGTVNIVETYLFFFLCYFIFPFCGSGDDFLKIENNKTTRRKNKKISDEKRTRVNIQNFSFNSDNRHFQLIGTHLLIWCEILGNCKIIQC